MERSTRVTYQVREFDLTEVEGISSQAFEDHLGLYKGYVENTNRLLEKSLRGNGNAGQEGWEHRLGFRVQRNDVARTVLRIARGSWIEDLRLERAGGSDGHHLWR